MDVQVVAFASAGVVTILGVMVAAVVLQLRANDRASERRLRTLLDAIRARPTELGPLAAVVALNENGRASGAYPAASRMVSNDRLEAVATMMRDASAAGVDALAASVDLKLEAAPELDPRWPAMIDGKKLGYLPGPQAEDAITIEIATFVLDREGLPASAADVRALAEMLKREPSAAAKA